MKYRTKTIIELTQEYILPVLELANIEVNPESGLMKPKDIETNSAYTEKNEAGSKFMICALNESAYNYHMRNTQTTTLFNPFGLNKKGYLDTYKLLKMTERILYCMEIDDFYTDSEELVEENKDEDTIESEMINLVQITKQEALDDSGRKIFSANVFNREIEQWVSIASIELAINEQCGLLLLISEVCKYYMDNARDDEVKYGNIDKKAFELYTRMEKLAGELDKNFTELKEYNKEMAEKLLSNKDDDMELDMGEEMGIVKMDPDAHKSEPKIATPTTENVIGSDVILDL